ncbi:MAG: hypothetical protein IKH13_07400 [Clostridia bacterium]|nr:hypothetical protein [Clostridia bacterium]
MKKIIALILTAGILLSLCACGNKRGGSKIETEPTEETVLSTEEQTVTTEAESETETQTQTEAPTQTQTEARTKKEISEREYKDAYRKFLKEYIRKNGAAGEGNNTKFGLIYLDEDDVPELVLSPRYEGRGTKLTIYAFDGEKVNKVDDYGIYGDFSFVVGKGILFIDTSHQGSGGPIYSRYKDGKITTLKEFYYAFDNTRYKYMSDDMDNPECYNYFIDDKPVSYEDYKAEEAKVIREYGTNKAVSAMMFMNYDLTDYEVDSAFESD